jgi:large repetitive protein
LSYLENRLTEVRDGDDTLIARYDYDPFGRRIWKEVGGARTYFFYAEEGLIAEADSSGQITRQYGWQPDGMWGTDPLYLKSGGQAYFYQNDHLGTPQKLVAVSGAVVWAAKFEAFGAVHVDVAQVENPLRFPGQYFDQESGLYYNWHRYYDPQTGRYITSDPIGLEGGLNTPPLSG